MSNLTLSRGAARVSTHAHDSGLDLEAPYVSVDIQRRGMERVWQQINGILIETLERSGFRPPNEVIEQTKPPPATWVTVAPGIIVRTDEYEERFGGIDLEELKGRMTPALFEAFVRHIGSIPGRPDLDVDEISAIPEHR